MGASQSFSADDVKKCFTKIKHLLKYSNLPFDIEFLSFFENLKNTLVNNNKSKKQDFCLVSKKYKNINDYQNKETQKENFSKWFEIINLIINNYNYTIPFKENIEKNIRDFYKNEKKYFLYISINSCPKILRSLIWITLSEYIPLERKDKYYNYLKNENTNPIYLEQIEKDIYRTFKEHKTEKEIKSLKNILVAFTNLASEIGYCQGMNFIAGFLLDITSFNEIDAFYLFTHILGKIRGYFIQDFPLFNYHLYIFNYYFKQFFPKLEKHFINLEFPLELWFGKWIQTLFIINFPFEETCRIWSCLFVYGFDFIIPLSLSIVYYLEDNLLKLNDSSDIMYFLKESLSPKDIDFIYENIEKNVILMEKIINKGKQYKDSINKDEIKKLKKKYEDEKNIKINSFFFNYKLYSYKIHQKSFSSQNSIHSIQKKEMFKLSNSTNLKTEESSIEIDEVPEIGEEYEEFEQKNIPSNRVFEIKIHNEK